MSLLGLVLLRGALHDASVPRMSTRRTLSIDFNEHPCDNASRARLNYRYPCDVDNLESGVSGVPVAATVTMKMAVNQ